MLVTPVARSPETTRSAKWMTLTELSGNMSQLYSEFYPASFWILVWN
jgi:hypothetical protein